MVATVLVLSFGGPATATEGAEIGGQVVAAGEPVAGVRVTLTPMVGQWHLGAQFLGLQPFEEPVTKAETDGEGRFTVVAPVAGFWSLRFEVAAAGRDNLRRARAPGRYAG